MHDTAKVRVLNRLCRALGNYLPDEAIKCANDQVEICAQLTLSREKRIARVGRDGLTNAYSILSQLYFEKGGYDASLTANTKFIENAEKANNNRVIPYGYMRIGNILAIKKEYDKAIVYYHTALKMFIDLNSIKEVANVYSNLGSLNNERGDYLQAEEFNLKALEIFKKIDSKKDIASTLNRLGENEAGKENYDRALNYFMEELKISEQIKSEFEKSMAFLSIGGVLNKKHQYQKAIPYNEKAIAFMIRTGRKDWLRTGYIQIADSYRGLNEMEKAFGYMHKYIDMHDSLYNIETSRQAKELLVKYETEKKEKDNKLLSQQNEIQALTIRSNRYFIFGMAILLLFILGGAYLFLKQNRLRAEQRSMQLEQKLLRSQMNPHFIFNSLNAIHSVVLTGDKKEAAVYLASFAKMIRAILEGSRFEYISLEKEIALLENYIKLQALRFENEIKYSINVDDKLDLVNTLLPPMLTQPFIENAIEHGLAEVKDGAELIISFKESADSLLIEVSDNGYGFTENKDKTHLSMAGQITNERLKLINRNQKRKAEFSMSDAFPANTERKGLKVSFFIPLS
jgi:tetratricopeptide (TPR) repeat protein